MKHPILFLLLVLSSYTWSQKGFDVIHKAERKIERGNYTRALHLLEKAEKMNYGFCGNAWIEAQESILIDKAEIYSKTGNHLLAANTLNEFSFWMYLYHPENVDSLKTVYCVNEFGKERVKHEIDSCLAILSWKKVDSMILLEDNTIQLHVSFLEKPFNISFWTYQAARYASQKKQDDSPIDDPNERLRTALRERPFYQVLR